LYLIPVKEREYIAFMSWIDNALDNSELLRRIETTPGVDSFSVGKDGIVVRIRDETVKPQIESILMQTGSTWRIEIT
jgi:hypothetical protein